MPLVKAHAVSAKRSFAVQRVSGMSMVLFFSTFGGLYLTAGGANKLQAIVWKPLREAVVDVTAGILPADQAYRVIGGTLLLAGVTGIMGLLTGWRWMTLLSCVIGAAWCAYAAVLFGREDTVPPPDDDNFVAFFAGSTAVTFVLRFLLLMVNPEKNPRDRDDIIGLTP